MGSFPNPAAAGVTFAGVAVAGVGLGCTGAAGFLTTLLLVLDATGPTGGRWSSSDVDPGSMNFGTQGAGAKGTLCLLMGPG